MVRRQSRKGVKQVYVKRISPLEDSSFGVDLVGHNCDILGVVGAMFYLIMAPDYSFAWMISVDDVEEFIDDENA